MSLTLLDISSLLQLVGIGVLSTPAGLNQPVPRSSVVSLQGNHWTHVVLYIR